MSKRPSILIVPEGYTITREGIPKCLGYKQEVDNRWGGKTVRNIREKELKTWRTSSGYLAIKFGKEAKPSNVHRLVAKVYLPNPHNLPK